MDEASTGTARAASVKKTLWSRSVRPGRRSLPGEARATRAVIRMLLHPVRMTRVASTRSRGLAVDLADGRRAERIGECSAEVIELAWGAAQQEPAAACGPFEMTFITEFADGKRDRSSMGADHPRQEIVGQPQVEADAFWTNPPPAVGQMPEQEQYSQVHMLERSAVR